MDLTKVEVNKSYKIIQIQTQDEETDNFLFSLGCYVGEEITVISRRNGNCIVAINQARYSIDKYLAKSIMVQA